MLLFVCECILHGNDETFVLFPSLLSPCSISSVWKIYLKAKEKEEENEKDVGRITCKVHAYFHTFKFISCSL